jgi:hypothetical protein
MISSLLIIAGASLVGLLLIFGRNAPGILLGIAATLSALWMVAAILTA